MKILALGATALALVTFASLSAAMAQGPRASGGNSWPGISQPAATNLATAGPHYELQYHSGAPPPGGVGQWLLVRKRPAITNAEGPAGSRPADRARFRRELK